RAAAQPGAGCAAVDAVPALLARGGSRGPGAVAAAARFGDAPGSGAVSVYVCADAGGAGDWRGDFGAGGSVVGAASRAMAGPRVGDRVAGRAVVSELCAGTDSDSGVFDQAGMDAGVGGGHWADLRPRVLAVPGAAGDHAGQRAGGDPDAYGADGDAGRIGAGLHPHGAGEGAAGADGGVSSCARERADSRDDDCGVAVWQPAFGSDCDGDGVLVAGDRAADAFGDFEPRLCAGAGMHSGGGVDVCRGESADGRGVYIRESADASLTT